MDRREMRFKLSLKPNNQERQTLYIVLDTSLDSVLLRPDT